MVVVPVRKSVVVVVSILVVSSTSLVKPANRRQESLRNGDRSCSTSGDSAAYEERGTWKYEERSTDNIIHNGQFLATSSLQIQAKIGFMYYFSA